LGSKASRRCMRDDKVHVGTNQLSRQFGKSLIAPFRPAVFDGDVRALDITEVTQTQPEWFQPGGERRRRCRAQESNPRHLSRLLRACGNRPCSRAAEQRDELAPLHSITSSARASNADGTVRPSALAVTRLMTRSNLVGCSTGMSAGFAPRRILSTNSAVRR